MTEENQNIETTPETTAPEPTTTPATEAAAPAEEATKTAVENATEAAEGAANEAKERGYIYLHMWKIRLRKTVSYNWQKVLRKQFFRFWFLSL